MKKITVLFYLGILLCLLLSGCGTDRKGTVVPGTYYYPGESQTEKEEENQNKEKADGQEKKGQQVEAVLGTDLYLIISNDMTTEHMILEQLASGRQYMYYYSLTTRFLDKYGDNTTVSYFEPGRIITIGDKDSEGKIKEAQISNKVWEYPDIVRYSVDEDRGVFTIGDTKYSYGEDLFVASGGERIALSSLNENDEIRVIGMNKEILSVVVTTGCGKVELKNTELFEGSYIQIGKKIFAEITGEMTLEVPEGTYLVSVANKGYGGSAEVVINRHETVTIDLDELKGEGPKKGKILFSVNVSGADLQIDGRSIDYSEAAEVDYGVHTIAVYAAGYESYKKKLFVNSSEATILISLGDQEGDSGNSSSGAQEESSDDNTGGGAAAGGSAGSLAGSLAGSTSGQESTNQSSSSGGSTQTGTSSDDPSADYLSTLSELLSTIVN